MINKTELDRKAQICLMEKDHWGLWGCIKLGASRENFLRPLIFQACFAGDFSLVNILFIENLKNFPREGANILARKCKEEKNPYGLYNAIVYGAKDYLDDLIKISEEKGGNFLWFAEWARAEIAQNNI